MNIQWTIGKKLFASFVGLAFIVVAMGLLGTYGAFKSSDAIDELGEIVAEVESILRIQAAGEEVGSVMNTLAQPGLSIEVRQLQYKHLDQAREIYRTAWHSYESQAHSSEEAAIWSRLAPIWRSWESEVDRAIEMARRVDANGIPYPMELAKQLEGFSRDHYLGVQRVLELLLAGSHFEGGDDHTSCNIGRWMPRFQSTNGAIMGEIRGITEPHRRFHENVARIKQLVAANNKNAALVQYQEGMIPAMQAVFVGMESMQAIAVESVQLEESMRAQISGPVNARQHEAFELLEQLVALNNQAAALGVADASGLANFLKIISPAALMIGLVLALTISAVMTRSLTQPIIKTVAMFNEMSRGRLNARLNMERGDEIGAMAKTMDQFADNLQNQVVTALQSLSRGDLTFKVKPHDDQDVIGNALLKTGEDLNRVVGEIMAAAEQIAAGADQISGSSQSLSQGATESAASLEEITSSMTEMASQTKLNAENSTQASLLAGEAHKAAEGGNQQMEKMVTAMSEINQAGQNISKIIKVIDEIAFQTNLLALNAAVEAARAGRHGKGFAVVAEEVRNLAARSAKAAKETAELIEGSVRKTENGSQIATQTATSLREIVTAITKATDLVGEIAAASNEQAQGISQVNEGLNQIDQVTQTNTANAEQGAAAAEELSGQAEHLRQLMATFTIKGELAASRQRALPASNFQPGEAHNDSGFGNWENTGRNGKSPRPSRVIALDDREFGRY